MEEQTIQQTRYTLPFTVRPEWQSLLTFPALGFLLSLFLVPIMFRGPSAILEVIGIMVFIWIIFGLLSLRMAFNKISVLQDRIINSTLFTKQEILFSQITNISLQVESRRAYSKCGNS